ncbi:MAG: hypothetical protein SNJ77_04250 [Cytophagales bacterium]
MTKYILLFLALLNIAGKSQTVYNFVEPFDDRLEQHSCDVDVNSSHVNNVREDLKRAIFRLTTDRSYCSATFINNDALNGQPSNLFITAWHCFKSDGETCQGSEFDFNQNLILCFENRITLYSI